MVRVFSITGEDCSWINKKTSEHTFTEVCLIILKIDDLFYEVEIPIGFRTDFVSAGIFKSFLNNRNYRIASVVHDYCYKTHLFSFDESNKIFIELLKSFKENSTLVYLISLALKTPLAKKRYDSAIIPTL